MPLMHRRWFLLAVASLVNILIGSIYAWSVFAGPLAERLSAATGVPVAAGDLAAAFSVANAIGPVPMILGGWVTDRFGPRLVMAAGGVLACAGYVVAGNATTVAGIVLGYGVLFGLGLGFVYGCTINNTLKFFPDRRGLVGGVTTTCYGVSSVVIAPVATLLIGRFGVAATMTAIGVATGVVVLLGGFFSMKCPEGFSPGSGGGRSAASGREGRETDWRGMLRSARFWPMLALLLCGAVSGMMILSQAHSIGTGIMGLAPAAAASAVAFLAFSNMAGRLAAGIASDRFGRTEALGVALGFSIAGLGLLQGAGPENPFGFYAGLAATGFSFGAFMGVFPGFTAEEFGSRNNGVNYAIMFFGFALAGAAGPLLMNLLMQTSGFRTACLAGMAVASAGYPFIFIYRRLGLRPAA